MPINLIEPCHFVLTYLCRTMKESGSCICVLGVSIVPVSIIYVLDFVTVPTVLNLLCFVLLSKHFVCIDVQTK